MRRVFHSWAVACLCIAIAFAPMSVFAQSELSEAQQKQLLQYVDQGRAAYDNGEFQKSLELFRKAYDIYQYPDIIYRIALCHERLGEDQEAVKHYRLFLAEAPNAPERARVEKTIEVIEARIAKSEIRITTTPKGAAVFVDDEANGVAGYTPTALAVKPGNYKLIVKKSGFEPVSELVTVDPGQSVQLRYQLDEVGASTNNTSTGTTKKSGGPPPSVRFLVLASLGVAAGVTSVVFFGIHNDRAKAFADLEGRDSQDVPRKRFDQVKRQKNTALIVAVSTAAVAGFAFIWAYGTWVADRSAARRAGFGVGWQDDRPIVTYGFEW